MTRKEEICDVTKEQFTYVKDENLKSALRFAFIDGAKWADEHPNLESLWHDAHEEPQGEYEIICQDEFEHVWLTDWKEVVKQHASGWEEYAACECIVNWVYVSDLLPKGGKK